MEQVQQAVQASNTESAAAASERKGDVQAQYEAAIAQLEVERTERRRLQELVDQLQGDGSAGS